MNKKELHKMAPLLSEISPKNSGFTVPDGYFNSVEDGIIAEIVTHNLNKSTNEFKTPENYFENLEDVVIAKLKVETLSESAQNSVPDNYFETFEDNVLSKLNSKPKVISIKKVTKYLIPIAAAASFLLIFLLNNNSNSVTFESLASTEIEEWIDNGLVDLDPYQMANIYSDVEIDNNFISEKISENDIEDYLYKENIELLLIDN